MNLVLIKSFTYSFETTSSIAILENANIDYYLQESAISNLFDYLGQGVNGIKLFVNKDDEPEARKLFIEANILILDDEKPTTTTIRKILTIALVWLTAVLLAASIVLGLYAL